MRKLNLALIGTGNIMRTRHIPALATAKDHFQVIGVMDKTKNRAAEVAKQLNISNYCMTPNNDLTEIDWFDKVDCIIAATPPKEHAAIIDAAIQANKHILIEKPFVTNIKDGEVLAAQAQEKNIVIAVNHNFQFSGSFQKLEQVINSGSLGEIKSFYCVQFSNDTRRLPVWGDDLPLGLFYDESPHFFYLLRKFGKGDLYVKNVSYKASTKGKNTPQVLDINMEVNGLPATVYSNFESPICEWYFIVFGDKQYAMVDLFRDIITILPNDGQHLMKEVFKSSFLGTYYHWRGFISNGFRYIRHRLHYGTDVTQLNFYESVVNQNLDALKNMDPDAGLAVNRAQFEVVRLADHIR